MFQRVGHLFNFCVPVTYHMISWALGATVPGLVELSHVGETEDKQVNTHLNL